MRGLFLMLCLFLAKPALGAIDSLPGAPAGFEQLEAPRPTAVTLYYGGALLGNFAGRATPSTLQFDQPEKILAAIPSVAAKDRVLQALAQPLPANASLLCRMPGGGDGTCGILAPAVAGVIFDENALRAEIFINKNLLSVNGGDTERYLPLPERKFAAVYGLNGAVNGAGDQSPDFSIGSESVYSYGEAKFSTHTTYANQGVRFDMATAGVERRGWSAEAGLLRTQGLQLAGDQDLAGVSVGTSGRTVLDGRKSEGNDIIVYLPRRSFVSIFREGRLYSSRAYEAGNQRIDTADLPEGAYTVTLKIEDSNGGLREEKRFYAKMQDIPPPGHPVYYAQGGLMRKPWSGDSAIPQLTGKPVLRLGTVRRVGDSTAIGIGALGLQDRIATEASLTRIDEHIRLQGSALLSSAGDAGLAAHVFYHRDLYSADVDIRKSWEGEKADKAYEDVFNALGQATLTMAYAVRPDATLSARASYTAQGDAPASFSYGPAAEWRIWQKGESALTLNADAARDNKEGADARIGLRFTRRIGVHYGVVSTGEARGGGAGAGPAAGLRAWYDSVKPGSAIQAAAGINTDRSVTTLSGDADWRNDFGQVHGGIQQALGSTDSPLSYGGSFSFSAAQAGSSLHIGGQQSDKSALLIETGGDADTAMKIFINQSEVGRVQRGQKQMVYLSPFHTYRIRLEPENPGLFAYDANERAVTLYPGNVARLEWRVNRFYVIAAKIVTPDGAPLSGALLEGSREQIVTDENGRLQAELANPSLLRLKTEGGAVCQAALPQIEKPANGILIFKQPVPCHSVTQTAFLPFLSRSIPNR